MLDSSIKRLVDNFHVSFSNSVVNGFEFGSVDAHPNEDDGIHRVTPHHLVHAASQHGEVSGKGRTIVDPAGSNGTPE